MSTQRLHSNLPLTLLEWVARAGSIVSVALLALMFFGEPFHPSRITPREWVGLTFFPFGVVLGMIVAWWKEWLGSVVAVASLGAFYLIYGFVLGSHIGGWWFLIFTVPGFLFLLHALFMHVWIHEHR